MWSARPSVSNADPIGSGADGVDETRPRPLHQGGRQGLVTGGRGSGRRSRFPHLLATFLDGCALAGCIRSAHARLPTGDDAFHEYGRRFGRQARRLSWSVVRLTRSGVRLKWMRRRLTNTVARLMNLGRRLTNKSWRLTKYARRLT